MSQPDALESLVVHAVIPTQAYRLRNLVEQRPSLRGILDLVGVGRPYEWGDEQMVDVPVPGLIRAIKYAVLHRGQADADAAALMDATYHGSWPQFAGSWRTAKDIHDAMGAGPDAEQPRAFYALAALAGWAALAYTIAESSGDLYLPDDDNETGESVARLLVAANMCDKTGAINPAALLQAAAWHEEQRVRLGLEAAPVPDLRTD